MTTIMTVSGIGIAADTTIETIIATEILTEEVAVEMTAEIEAKRVEEGTATKLITIGLL